MASFTANSKAEMEMGLKMGLIDQEHYEAAMELERTSYERIKAEGGKSAGQIPFGLLETSFSGSEISDRYDDAKGKLRLRLTLDPKYSDVTITGSDGSKATMNLAEATALAKAIEVMCREAGKEVVKIMDNIARGND